MVHSRGERPDHSDVILEAGCPTPSETHFARQLLAEQAGRILVSELSSLQYSRRDSIVWRVKSQRQVIRLERSTEASTSLQKNGEQSEGSTWLSSRRRGENL